MSDTIFALSSGPLPSGVAVVRVSGTASSGVLNSMVARDVPARQATLATLRDPVSGLGLDRALVLWFPGPASFTGEDTIEFHLHGGRAVVAAVMKTLREQPGLRFAAPGEFSKRAFMNGKLDLTEAEGLADLMAAETEAQRRQALAQAGGALRRLAEDWRETLLDLSASLTASIDFSDEGDVPDDVARSIRSRAAGLKSSIDVVLAGANQGELIRDGFSVVIAGPPNSGKSTLLNALVRRDAAIVSSIPGTTRDLIEVTIDMEGLPVVFVDTAGLRDSADPIEQEGITRTRRRAAQADLRLWLSDDGCEPPGDFQDSIRIRTKMDEGGALPGEIAISAKTGFGLAALSVRMVEELGGLSRGEPALVTHARQRHHLADASSALERLASSELPAELAAEELRLAVRALEELTGRVGVEDVLGVIFSRFCIGK